jgi:hypothetical protein
VGNTAEGLGKAAETKKEAGVRIGPWQCRKQTEAAAAR